MAGYIKKIAVIKQVKTGFSADGGAISGLVKAETYAGFLKVEISLINFAPTSEGKYVFGICDGLTTVIFDGLTFEGESDFNLSSGFAFLVCFCHTGVAPIASAACGQMACALPDLKEEMARRENTKLKKDGKEGVAYDDEAISEINYYEQRETFEGGHAVCEDTPQKKDGRASGEDEADLRAVEGDKKDGVNFFYDEFRQPAAGDLAGGDFYSRMRGDIERIFAAYPREGALERAMEGSRFVRISYGQGKFYVFGVLTVEGKPRYICYGVPSSNSQTPPQSLQGCAGYVPVDGGNGYWITYQDAITGVSVPVVNS